MKHDPKIFLQKLKLYFTTLFARTMPKAIFGTPDLKDNQILFSNIDLEEAELYTPDPEYFIHLVSLKDEDFVNDLYEQFPLLKKAIVLLFMDQFFAAVNKHDGELKQIQLIHKDDTVIVLVCTNGSMHGVTCGKVISSYQASRYLDIFKSGTIDKETSVSVPLTNKISLDDKLTVLDLGKLFNDSNDTYTCALLNNQSTISVKEFLKKAEIKNFTHAVLSIRQGSSVKLNIWFSCPVLDVISTQPAVVWFPHNTKSPIVI